MKDQNSTNWSIYFKKTANLLTITRIIFGFIIIVSLEFNLNKIGFIFLLLGGLSDYFDGWFARKSGGGSKWGARYDPLADKVLIYAPLIWFCRESFVPMWSIWFIITRDLVVSNWRASETNGGAANKLGKIKTFLQYSSLLLLIYPSNLNILIELGVILYWFSFVISIISGCIYFRNK